MGKDVPTRVIKLVKNGALVAEKCIVAESFLSRLKGLIGTQKLELGSGLLLRPCNDIHMWFMSIPIDVVFVRVEKTSDGKNAYYVSSVRKELQPWRVFPVRDFKASETLELPIGTIDRCNIVSGDELCIN